MAMPAAERRRWTLREVRDLIAANPLVTPRYELVDGELIVTPSPRPVHQIAVRELMLALHGYLRREHVGEVLGSPSDVELEPESTVQPDVYVMAPEEFARIRREPIVRKLLLAIEVLSTASAGGDRGSKRLLYQRHVSEYWIVDLDARLIERWRPGDVRPEILREALEWRPAGSTSALSLDLPAFFAIVLGDEG